MVDYLQTTVGKFLFKVAVDRYYTNEGIWVLQEGDQCRLGISDFLQQRSGDVAFIEVKPEGTKVSSGDEFVVIETIKVNISLASPITGTIVTINPLLTTTPEIINQDPFGVGWLVIIKPSDWEFDQKYFLEPNAYFLRMKAQAEEAAR
jgi:glycine cleavage system H protein